MTQPNFFIRGDTALIERMDNITPKIRDELRKAVTKFAIKLQARVVGTKLSGQVLHRRTGTLARSIKWNVKESTGSVIAIVGSRANESNELRYAGIHEYGFKGVVTVKAHMRTIKQAFGKPLKSAVQVSVKSYSMKMNMPERSFLRSSLAEMKEEIKAGLTEAARKGAEI